MLFSSIFIVPFLHLASSIEATVHSSRSPFLSVHFRYFFFLVSPFLCTGNKCVRYVNIFMSFCTVRYPGTWYMLESFIQSHLNVQCQIAYAVCVPCPMVSLMWYVWNTFAVCRLFYGVISVIYPFVSKRIFALTIVYRKNEPRTRTSKF